MYLKSKVNTAALTTLAAALIASGGLKAYPGKGSDSDEKVQKIVALAQKGQITMSEFVDALGQLEAEGIVFSGNDILVTNLGFKKNMGVVYYDAIVLIRADNRSTVSAIKTAFNGEFKDMPDGGQYLVC